MATVRVVFFAHLREMVQMENTSVAIVDLETSTIASLMEHLMATIPSFKTYYQTNAILTALNQQMSNIDATIQAGDEVALFPPVTGG